MEKIIVNSLIRRWDERVPTALLSVLRQTYTNWVYYILATPTSAPAIKHYLEEVEEDTSRVFIEIEEANHFVEGTEYLTRKILEHAPRGDFFCNLDGDDALEPHFMEKQLQAIHQTGADIACAGIRKYDEQKGEVRDRPTVPKQVLILRKQYYLNDDIIHCFFTSIWGKLFRSSLFTKDVFQKIPPFQAFGAIGHDTMTSLALLKKAKKIVVTEGVGYHYTVWNGSLAHEVSENLVHCPRYLYDQVRLFYLTVGKGKLTRENQAQLYRIYRQRQHFVLEGLFHTPSSPDERMKKYHQVMTEDISADANRHVPDEEQGVLWKYFIGFYQEMAPQLGNAPLAELLDKKTPLGLYGESFYQAFLVLSPENKTLPYDVFVEKLFYQNRLDELTQGRYQLAPVQRVSQVPMSMPTPASDPTFDTTLDPTPTIVQKSNQQEDLQALLLEMQGF